MKRYIAFIVLFVFGVCKAGTEFALRQYGHSICMQALYNEQYQKSGAKDLKNALLCGHYEKASLLISAKNVNEQDNLGRTPLMWLATNWWYSSPTDKRIIKHLTKKLLEHGADIDITDEWHNTVFDIAWKDNSHEFVDFLLQEHAKLQQAKRFNTYKEDVLQYIHQANEEEKNLPIQGFNTDSFNYVRFCSLKQAILSEHYESAYYMLDLENADPNEKDSLHQTGRTPLMWLVFAWMAEGFYGKEKIKTLVRKLLEHGADMSIRDKDGCTVFDLAKQQRNCLDFIEFLQQERETLQRIQSKEEEEDDENKQPMSDEDRGYSLVYKSHNEIGIGNSGGPIL